MEAEIRKNRDMLYYSGIGLIVLELWDMLKNAVFIWLDPRVLAYLSQDLEDPLDAPLYLQKIVVIAVCMFLFMIGLFFRMFIGLNAVGESKGKKKGKFYLIMTALFILIKMYSTGREVFIRTTEQELFLTSFLLDITTIFAAVQIIYRAVRLRKLTGKRKPET